jgi:hypothetical protein
MQGAVVLRGRSSVEAAGCWQCAPCPAAAHPAAAASGTLHSNAPAGVQGARYEAGAMWQRAETDDLVDGMHAGHVMARGTWTGRVAKDVDLMPNTDMRHWTFA